MQKTLTLALVIPAYNEERYLQDCLESVKSQTEPPDEVIVIDNNSTDSTAKIALAYPFVTVLKEPQQGVVFARNRGFNAAKSVLIGRIDADSVLSPTWVEDVKKHYRESAKYAELYVATGPSSFRNIGARLFWYPLHRVFYFWLAHIWMGNGTLGGSNMYITRALWEKVKPNICLRTDIHEDMDLAWHIHRMGIPIIFTKAFHDSMLNRRYLYKMRYYIPMFWRIRFIDHAGSGESADRPQKLPD